MSGLREFGIIRSSLWESQRFRSLQSLDARLAYVWLHTSHKTSAGVLRIGPAHLLDEVDFVQDLERANAVFEEMEGAGLITRVRPYIVIAKFLTANPVKTFRHAIGAFREVLHLPDSDEKHRLFSELQTHKGATDLASWRDTKGEPHKVLHEINRFAMSAMPPEPDQQLNPSETHQEGFGNASGRIENIESKIEKRKMKTGATGQDDAQADEGARLREPAPVTDVAPLRETVAAARKLEERFG